MKSLGTFWPRQDERRLLGRFYLADGVSELFNVIWPFQFAYLLMVMDRPEWAVAPLLVESTMALIAEIPIVFLRRGGPTTSVVSPIVKETPRVFGLDGW